MSDGMIQICQWKGRLILEAGCWILTIFSSHYIQWLAITADAKLLGLFLNTMALDVEKR